MVVALAGSEAAAHRGTGLVAALASLWSERTNQSKPVAWGRGSIKDNKHFYGHIRSFLHVIIEVSDHQATPGHSTVDVEQRAVVFLKHLGRPQAAVDVGPVVLAQVEQPASLLSGGGETESFITLWEWKHVPLVAFNQVCRSVACRLSLLFRSVMYCWLLETYRLHD